MSEQEESKSLDQKAERNRKLKTEITADNQQLQGPLDEAESKVKELRHKLQNYDKVCLSVCCCDCVRV